MILEVDAGNTRIKWRLLKSAFGAADSPVVQQAAGFVLAKRRVPSVFLDLGLQLDEQNFSQVRRVKVSSVRGAEFENVFCSWMYEKWQIQPEFSRVEEVCGGVRNSYSEASSLGVDRWLAMLAAFNDAKGACCVVDCGSAITVDCIDSVGVHQGGYIVPGFVLMREALARKSNVLEFDSVIGGSIELGVNTVDAIQNGMLSMVLGLIERVKGQYKGDDINWYLCGGDAALISPFLQWEHKVMPDLVMDGLSIALY